MMRRSPVIRLLAIALAGTLAALHLAGCDGEDYPDPPTAGTSTETVTGKSVGFLYLADGSPARGAKVSAYPVGRLPVRDSVGSAVYLATTDDQGRYVLNPTWVGEYNILGEKDGLASYQDSVYLSKTGRTLASDTLRSRGLLSGYVSLEPGDPLQSVTVQVFGTYAFANVDSAGRFTLPYLPTGRYRAAVSTTLQDYTTQYVELEVRTGEHTHPDTLGPIFIGIPLVQGLAARFDTLAQVVFLSWSPSDYTNLKDYLIYRGPKGTVQAYALLGATSDTSFQDSLGKSAPQAPSTSSSPEWEYRVAIRDQFGFTGRTFGGAEIEAPPASAAGTQVTVRTLGLRGGAASIGDTVRLVAEWKGSSRDLTLLRWFRPGSPAPIRSVAGVARAGEDTLVFVCPAEASTQGFRVEVADDGGAEWAASTTFDVRLDPPTIRMAPWFTARVGDSVGLHADVADGIGRVVGVEWDIGGTGQWVASLANDTVIELPSDPKKSYLCIARVTDDDGLTALDTTVFQVSPWKKGRPIPQWKIDACAAGFGGKAYLFGGRVLSGSQSEMTGKAHAYDPVADAWEELPALDQPRFGCQAGSTDSTLLVFGGTARSGFSEAATAMVRQYHPATRTWSNRADMPRPRTDFLLAHADGKFYLFGGTDGTSRLLDTMDVYDPALDRWESLPAFPGDWQNHSPFPWDTQENPVSAAGLGSGAYIVHAYAGSTVSINSYDVSSQNKTFRGYVKLAENQSGSGLQAPKAVSANGRLYLAGGQMSPYSGGYLYMDRVHVLHPGTGAWEEWYSLPEGRNIDSFVSTGKRIFALGGWGVNGKSLETIEWAEIGE